MPGSEAPYFDLLGITTVEAQDGRSKLSMPYRKELTNPYGRIHGGAIVSLADSAMAVAMDSRYPHPFYTTKLEVKFKSAVEGGVLWAEARLGEKKKNFVFGKVTVKSDKGDLLAEVSATFIIPNDKGL